jgi:hypothetical protein
LFVILLILPLNLLSQRRYSEKKKMWNLREEATDRDRYRHETFVHVSVARLVEAGYDDALSHRVDK